jgi:hypothetical protein
MPLVWVRFIKINHQYCFRPPPLIPLAQIRLVKIDHQLHFLRPLTLCRLLTSQSQHLLTRRTRRRLVAMARYYATFLSEIIITDVYCFEADDASSNSQPEVYLSQPLVIPDKFDVYPFTQDETDPESDSTDATEPEQQGNWPMSTDLLKGSKNILLTAQRHQIKLAIRKTMLYVEEHAIFHNSFPRITTRFIWNRKCMVRACEDIKKFSPAGVKVIYDAIAARIQADDEYLKDVSTLVSFHIRFCFINTQISYPLD